MENETRSERAKRMRAEGTFRPKNPGRPRKPRGDTEIQRRSLLDTVQNGTHRQRLEAVKQLQSLDERRGAPRPEFSLMGEATIGGVAPCALLFAALATGTTRPRGHRRG